MSYLDRARGALAEIEARGLRRRIVTHEANAPLADFASNDYLGLSRCTAVLEAMRGARFAGSGGSRLLSGAHVEHAALEKELAHFVKRERALLFSSGYLAGVGAIHAASLLVEHAYSDADNHASIIDGLRLTRLTRHVFPHLQAPREEKRGAPALLVCESLFGMSGEHADIPALLERLGADDVLLLDEAHALGVCGERGSGLASTYDDERIVIVGTLSKAFGCAGGFIAGRAEFIELAINTARTFIFDTAMPPATARAARAALHAIEEGDDLRARLAANSAQVAEALRNVGGFSHVPGSPILPLIAGDARKAVSVSDYLLERGIYAPAIRPPTVPPGTARVRFTVRADHTEAEIAALHTALSSATMRSL